MDFEERTLVHLLPAVDLGDLLLDQLVTLLTDLDDLGARDTELLHGGEHILGDLRGSLVLGESVGVVEGVVYAS